MNIPRLWKLIVGTIGSIGTVVTGIERIIHGGSDLWRNLDPWTFTFWLFVAMLVALGIAAWTEALDKRFIGAKKGVDDQLTELNRSINGLTTQFDNRIGTVHENLTSAISALTQTVERYRADNVKRDEAETNARSQTDNDLSRRIGELEKKSTSSSASAGAQS